MLLIRAPGVLCVGGITHKLQSIPFDKERRFRKGRSRDSSELYFIYMPSELATRAGGLSSVELVEEWSRRNKKVKALLTRIEV